MASHLTPASMSWLLRRRYRLFAKRSTTHIVQSVVRDEIHEKILGRIGVLNDRGMSMQIDPGFPVRINEEDVATDRLDQLFQRLNRVRFADGVTFHPGLEKRLMASYQRDGKHFEWKHVPQICPTSMRFIDARIGFGLFADRRLTEGEFVGKYIGVVTPYEFLTDRTYAHEYPSLKCGEDEEVFSIHALTRGNHIRFINHARPECVSHLFEFFGGHWHALFTANRPIEKDEQLFIDYGDSYWEGNNRVPEILEP